MSLLGESARIPKPPLSFCTDVTSTSQQCQCGNTFPLFLFLSTGGRRLHCRRKSSWIQELHECVSTPELISVNMRRRTGYMLIRALVHKEATTRASWVSWFNKMLDTNSLTLWLMTPGGSMPHSQELSSNSYPEPN
jgi:hypothetical protein